ncbi:MAG: RNA 2',3'-cyclic phosphodiesterase [Candidatus Aminicenantales bacterium]
MRTFIAIDLDDSLKDRLTALIRTLNTGEKNVRWVKPQGLHLTLKFLGHISQDRVLQVKEVLKRLSHECSSFPLRLKGTGSFPAGKKPPRVLWVGVEHNEPLLKLQARIEKDLEGLGFPAESRAFHPHLTLGRVKRPQGLEPILSELNRHGDETFGEMRVGKITFFSSTLTPSGAEYSVLSEYPLE